MPTWWGVEGFLCWPGWRGESPGGRTWNGMCRPHGLRVPWGGHVPLPGRKREPHRLLPRKTSPEHPPHSAESGWLSLGCGLALCGTTGVTVPSGLSLGWGRGLCCCLLVLPLPGRCPGAPEAGADLGSAEPSFCTGSWWVFRRAGGVSVAVSPCQDHQGPSVPMCPPEHVPPQDLPELYGQAEVAPEHEPCGHSRALDR